MALKVKSSAWLSILNQWKQQKKKILENWGKHSNGEAAGQKCSLLLTTNPFISWFDFNTSLSIHQNIIQNVKCFLMPL